MALKRIGSDCRDCTERYPGCHDHCENYIEARKKWDEQKQQIKHTKGLADELYKYKIESIKKQRSKYGK